MPEKTKALAMLLLTVALLGTQLQCISQNFWEGASGASISSFAGTPMAITAGGSAQLIGVFSNGTGVITPGNLPATSGKPVNVTPSATTVYTLTVSNAEGSTATEEAGITVLPAGAAVITPNAVQASGAQQTTPGGTFSNSPVVGEPVPAVAAGSLAKTLLVRHDFLPPVPAAAQ